MASSAPNKQFPGQIGFPTPNAPPDDRGCRVFKVPADEEWYALLMAAVYTLTYEFNWFDNGTLSKEESAAAWLEIIDQAYEDSQALEACPSSDVAPYWDDPEGGDLEGNPEEGEGFPWFGTITIGEGGFPVFIGDNELSSWLIGAFVAIVSGEDKGVRFLTAAKRFRIALQTNDLGGAVEIFINGILVQLTDTYSTSPGLRYVDVITDGVPALGMGAEDTRYELLIRQSTPHAGVSVPQLRLVRKRLWAGEVAPINTRYDGDCNCVQVTYDDGETWVTRPDADPRHGLVYLIPAIPDSRCAAAAGMVELVRRCIDMVLHAADVTLLAAGILDIIAVLTGGAGIIIDLIVVVAEALIAIGAFTIDGAFNSEAYSNLLCAFYCNFDGNGAVTADDIPLMQAQIDSSIGGTVSIVMALFFNLYGEVQLQNAGVKFADSEADCSPCEEICPPLWAKTWNWETTDYTGELDTAITIGSWSLGQGIVSADVPIDHRYASSEFVVIGHFDYGNQPCTIDHYEADVFKPSGSDQDCQIGAVAYIYPLSGTGEIHLEADGSFYDHSTENTTTHTFQNYTSNGPGSKPTMYYRRLKLSGTGHCPFVNPDP